MSVGNSPGKMVKTTGVASPLAGEFNSLACCCKYTLSKISSGEDGVGNGVFVRSNPLESPDDGASALKMTTNIPTTIAIAMSEKRNWNNRRMVFIREILPLHL